MILIQQKTMQLASFFVVWILLFDFLQGFQNLVGLWRTIAHLQGFGNLAGAVNKFNYFQCNSKAKQVFSPFVIVKVVSVCSSLSLS